MTTSSARPERLRRHRDTTDTIADALVTRSGHLDDALVDYRAGCDFQFRAPTVATEEVVANWAESIRELGAWTGTVGDAFIETMAVHRYMGGTPDGTWMSTTGDPDDKWSMSTELVVPYVDDDYEDPFLGYSTTGFTIDASDDGVAENVEGSEDLLTLLEDLGLSAAIGDNTLRGFLDIFSRVPVTSHITVQVTATHVVFFADGSVLRRMTRAEATARIISPRIVSPRLLTLSRWTGRVSGALTFASGAIDQWYADQNLPTSERILRTGTKGLSVLGGALAVGAGGVALGGTCGPAAPVCSTVLGLAGGVLGAFAGGWLADFLPWMDDPPDPSKGEYDLDALEDEIAQTDGTLSSDFEPVDAVTSLIGMDVALAETSGDPDLESHLRSVLPSRQDLMVQAGVIESTPPTGTTTTTIPQPTELPQPTEPEPRQPSDEPGPSPEPVTPTGTTVPAS